MKPNNIRLILFFLLSISTSCVHAQRTSNKGFEDDFLLGRDPSKKVFIVTKTGEMITGNEISFPKLKKSKSYSNDRFWIAIDDRQVPDSDIIAYQTEKEYQFKDLEHITHQMVYVTRLRYGKIDLFVYNKMYLSGKDFVEYHAYTYKKGNSPMQVLNKENFSADIADNAEASSSFADLFPSKDFYKGSESKTLKNITSVVDIYNK